MAPPSRRMPASCEVVFHPRPQRRPVAGSVVAVVKGKQIEAVVRKQLERCVQRRKLVDIDEGGEHAVVEPVLHGSDPLVHHMAEVERGHAPVHAAFSTAGGRQMYPVRLTVDRPRTRQPAQRLGDGQSGLQAILVEAGAEVAAAEPRVARALQVPQPPLRGHRRQVEGRMLVFERSQHLARIGIAVGVQRDEQRFARHEALEPVHPVGDANVGRPVLAGVAEIVPARPDTAALRHQLRILVQHGGVSACSETRPARSCSSALASASMASAWLAWAAMTTWS